MKITTSFIKGFGENSVLSRGGYWTSRITVEQRATKRSKNQTVAMFYYAAMDANNDMIGSNLQPSFDDPNDPSRITGFSGVTASLGKFKMTFVINKDSASKVHQFFHTVAKSNGPDQFTNDIISRLRLYSSDEASGKRNPKNNIIGLDPKYDENEPGNFVAVQMNFKLPFTLDVVYHLEDLDDHSSHEWLMDTEYTKRLALKEQMYNTQFEDTFSLTEKGFDEKAIKFAQATLSNMIGGIGYFYGNSLVKSELIKEPTSYWSAPLYSGVPSRSFFPRGFLWDEGFHNLLISKWNPEISADIMAHWLDLMNSEGWIPREQILGPEARAKVPAEFVVQNNKNANPPTLLLTLHSMLKDMSLRENGQVPDWFKSYLHRFWPRLVTWYNWFDSSQGGEVPGTFRWRGRNPNAINELNPKTLTSGLDDFPRASHPTMDERHVDLRCWMALASSLMSDIGNIIGKEKEALKYAEISTFLRDSYLLDSMHWSQEHNAYLDYGLHTEGVRLQRPPPPKGQPMQHNQDKIRVVTIEPKLQYVNQLGYISLFPFILGVLDPKSPKIPKILDSIEDPNKLFTPFGLRSLSKDASLYNKKNTEHDAPYWRGPIWININFLVVRALYNLKEDIGVDKSVRTQAQRIYTKLRNGIIDNVIKEYYRTGYVWEQYDDKTGQGKGCKPFTGWSALVVLMMGERY